MGFMNNIKELLDAGSKAGKNSRDTYNSRGKYLEKFNCLFDDRISYMENGAYLFDGDKFAANKSEIQYSLKAKIEAILDEKPVNYRLRLEYLGSTFVVDGHLCKEKIDSVATTFSLHNGVTLHIVRDVETNELVCIEYANLLKLIRISSENLCIFNAEHMNDGINNEIFFNLIDKDAKEQKDIYTCKCRNKDKAGNIIDYTLIKNGSVINISSKELKENIRNNKIEVSNLKLTSDNRLIVSNNTYGISNEEAYKIIRFRSAIGGFAVSRFIRLMGEVFNVWVYYKEKLKFSKTTYDGYIKSSLVFAGLSKINNIEYKVSKLPGKDKYAYNYKLDTSIPFLDRDSKGRVIEEVNSKEVNLSIIVEVFGKVDLENFNLKNRKFHLYKALLAGLTTYRLIANFNFGDSPECEGLYIIESLDNGLNDERKKELFSERVLGLYKEEINEFIKRINEVIHKM